MSYKKRSYLFLVKDPKRQNCDKIRQKALFWFVLVNILCLLDVLTTIWGLTVGLQEINPLMANWMAIDQGFAIAGKVAITFYTSLILYEFRVLRTLIPLALLHLAVVLWNSFNLLVFLKGWIQ